MIVRKAGAGDHDGMYEVCVRTGDDGGDASALYAHPELLPEIYLGAYLRFDPELCWCVDDGGQVTGYVVGTADTAGFEARTERDWWPSLRARYPLSMSAPGSKDAGLLRLIHQPRLAKRSWLDRYPAHLHIDLLPQAQGHGLGRRLKAEFERALRGRGIAGMHLGVSATNQNAIGFYRHLGFTQIDGDAGGLILAKDLTAPDL